METTILTHNFFSWPYHAVLSSKPHLALLLLGRGYSTGSPLWSALWAAAPARRSVNRWRTRDRKLRLQNSNWQTAHISHGHLHIAFHKTYTFPVNHVIVSAYFRWYVLCRESDWWLGQGSICNNYISGNSMVYIHQVAQTARSSLTMTIHFYHAGLLSYILRP